MRLGSVLKAGAVEGSDPDLDLAEAQFLAPRSLSQGSKLNWYLVQSPEQIAVRALVLVTVLLLFKVISIFVGSLLHLTDTILLSYPFKLYFASCVVLLVLVNTRRSYFPRRVANNQRRKPRDGRYWHWVRYGTGDSCSVKLHLICPPMGNLGRRGG